MYVDFSQNKMVDNINNRNRIIARQLNNDFTQMRVSRSKTRGSYFGNICLRTFFIKDELTLVIIVQFIEYYLITLFLDIKLLENICY